MGIQVLEEILAEMEMIGPQMDIICIGKIVLGLAEEQCPQIPQPYKLHLQAF